MSHRKSVTSIADTVFDGMRLGVSDVERENLVQNILEIERRGLTSLNERLAEGGRKIRDTIAEHNFCSELISKNKSESSIWYEPKELWGMKFYRPIDFVLKKDENVFWIQMKRLSLTEREKRKESAIKDLERRLPEIKVNKYMWCDFSSDFGTGDVDSLVDFISNLCRDNIDNMRYSFQSSGKVIARVRLWRPRKVVREHLKLAGCGGMEFVEVAGESKVHIFKSILNASGAFERGVDSKNINLVAMELDNACHDLIDVGEAVFGNELTIHTPNGGVSWKRDNNGFFCNPDLNKKVAGVIILERKDSGVVTKYNKTLFLNELYADRLNEIRRILDFDSIFRFCDFIDV